MSTAVCSSRVLMTVFLFYSFKKALRAHKAFPKLNCCVVYKKVSNLWEDVSYFCLEGGGGSKHHVHKTNIQFSLLFNTEPLCHGWN